MSYTVHEGTEQVYGDVGVPVLGVGQDGVKKALPIHTLEPDQFSVDEVNVPAAHAAAVITFPAPGVGLVNVLSGVAYSYGGSGTLAGGRFSIADGSETVFDIDVNALGERVINFTPPRKGRPNRAMTLTLADGGANVQGKLNVLGHWLQGQPVTSELIFSDETESGMLMLLF